MGGIFKDFENNYLLSGGNMKNDIVFVSSIDFLDSSSRPSLGILSLKQMLDYKYSSAVVCFDLLNHKEEIKYEKKLEDNIAIMTKYLLDLYPRIVSFYTMCNSYIVSVLLAKELKKRNKDIKIVFGGPQATMSAEATLRAFEFIDAISIGEGELSIEETVEALIGEREYSDVHGLVYRKSGEIVFNSSYPFLDNEELSKYSVKNFEPYDIKEYANIDVGRGCPYNCSFCSTSIFWGRRYRIKSVDSIINEVLELNRKFNVKNFGFEHDMFTGNRTFIMDFCNKFEKMCKGFTWNCSSRIDTIDDEMIDAFVKAGCKTIFVGIESGSNKMQKILHKNLNLKEVARKIKRLKTRGINLIVSFIYGFKDEGENDFIETIKFIEYLYSIDVNNIQLHLYIPLTHTEETEKVKGLLYFDKEIVNYEMDNSLEYSDESIELIKKYPNIFCSYYTFDTPIRLKYKRFGEFIQYINFIFKSYSRSLKFLVKSTGLINLYLRYEQLLIEVLDLYGKNLGKKQQYDEEKKSLKKFYDLFEHICFSELVKNNSDYFKAVFDYEKTILKFDCEKQKIKTKKFDFDVCKLVQSNVLVKSVDRYLIYRQENNSIMVTKIK